MKGTVLVSIALACSTLGACSRGSAKPDPAPIATVAPPAPPPKPEGPLERIMKADDYASALGIAAPVFKDATEQTDPGALLLTAWAIPNMKWSDVAAVKDETSYALARKDSDEARGKRLCASGTLIQIEKQKSDIGKFFDGLLTTYSGSLFHFLAAGSTGTLVQNSTARICGVVTGLYDYSNSGGGVGHAVQLVGMFDLPENKVVAKASTAAPSPNGQDKPSVGGGATKARTPSVRQGATQVNGKLAPAVIQGVVRQNFGAIRTCYDAGLSTNPSLQGRVTANFVIDRVGNILSVADGGSDLPDPSVAACVLGVFRGMKFPAPDGGIVTVVYPIVFSLGW